MKTFWTNSVIVLLSTICAVAVCEAALRFSPYASLLPFEAMPQFYYEQSEAAGYDIAKNVSTSTHRFKDGSYAIWSNELGCFDTPYKGEQPYTLLVGDSFAWGFAPFEDKWGTRLETYIGQRILKCGVPGYGTLQELLKAKTILSSLPQPSRILLSYFSNDESDDAAFPNSLVYEGKLIKNLSNDPSLTYAHLQEKLPQYARFAEAYCMWNMPEHPSLQRVKCFLRRNSILYVLTQSGIKKVIPASFLKRINLVNEESYNPQVVGTEHTEHVLAFLKLAHEHNAELVVVFIPSKEDVLSSNIQSPYEGIKKELTAHTVAFIDPLAEFRIVAAATSAPLFWPHDLHLNEKGNHLLGLVIARYLAHTDGQSAAESAAEAAHKKEFGL